MERILPELKREWTPRIEPDRRSVVVRDQDGRWVCTLDRTRAGGLLLSDCEEDAQIIAAAPDANVILQALRDWFAAGKAPIHGSALILDDDRTFEQAISDYFTKLSKPVD